MGSRHTHRTLMGGFMMMLVIAITASEPYASPSQVTKNIVFRNGSDCWTYSGSGSKFIGKFKAGQRVDVTMAPRGEWKIIPFVFANFANDGLDTKPIARDNLKHATGQISFIVPKTERYSIWFLPMVIWNSPGYVKICAN